MKLTKQNLLWSLLFGGKGGGITPSGTLSIASNGTYDVGAFAEASVLVPASAVVSGTKQISANGTHDVTAFANAEVLVPASAVCSGTISITSNGVTNVTGYANADVNVAAPSGTISISSNGTHNVAAFAEAEVMVPDEFVQRYLQGTISIIRTSVAWVKSYIFRLYGFASGTEVHLDNVTNIPSSAFTQTSGKFRVFLPNVTTISNSAFYYCADMKEVSAPKVTTIGTSAGYQANNIEYIYFPECTYMGKGAFNWISGACSYVSLPKLETAGEQALTFGTKVTYVSLPNLHTASQQAFTHYSSMTTLSLPKMSSFGTYAFSGWVRLVSLYLLGSSVAALAASAFSSTPLRGYTSVSGEEGKIYVPESLYDTYTSATNWVALSSRIVSLTDAQIAALG